MTHQSNRLMAAAVVAASVLAGSAAPASAHGYIACCDAVRDFCGLNDPACINSGCNQCMFHSHPDSGNAPPPPDVPKTSDQGRQPQKGFGLKWR